MALDFLILYEHTVREYESDLLLKLELERRGYKVEIRQLLDPKHLRLFRQDKPEVLVASCIRGGMGACRPTCQPAISLNSSSVHSGKPYFSSRWNPSKNCVSSSVMTLPPHS